MNSPAGNASASASPARLRSIPRSSSPTRRFSALDVSIQAQVLRLLADLKVRLNLALVFITHDLRVAATICDTVAVMRKGEVVEMGPAAEIFGAPKHENTRRLIEAIPAAARAMPSRAGRRSDLRSRAPRRRAGALRTVAEFAPCGESTRTVMKFIFDPRQLLHDPELYFRRGAFIPHPEQPQRAILVRDALLAAAMRWKRRATTASHR